MADEKYRLTLEGSEIDEALLRLANYEDEGLVLGSRKGVMLGPGSEYYHKNARYYAELAQSAVPGDTTSAVRWDIDQSALTDADREMARKNIRAGGSNRNLLDNPWFTVRQKGDGPFSGSGYTVDRWKIAGGNPTITPRSNYGIDISYSTAIAFDQYLDIDPQYLRGKTVTLSVMVGGVVYSGTGVYTANAYDISVIVGNTMFRLGYLSSTGRVFVRFGNVAANVQTDISPDAVKLELGSVSTLANDAPPEYGTELLKCMRYFIRINAPYYNNGFGIGRATGGTTCLVFIPLPVPLRASPTVSYSAAGNLQLIGNGSNYSVTALAYSGRSEVGVNLSITTSGISTNHLYFLTKTSQDCYIDLSADL